MLLTGLFFISDTYKIQTNQCGVTDSLLISSPSHVYREIISLLPDIS